MIWLLWFDSVLPDMEPLGLRKSSCCELVGDAPGEIRRCRGERLAASAASACCSER